MNVERKVIADRPQITDEERARRKEAVDFARGSVRYEGFEMTAEVEAINRRFIDGELTIAEHVAAIAAL